MNPVSGSSLRRHPLWHRMVGRVDLVGLVARLLAPVGALLVAFAISAAVLGIRGESATTAFSQMFEYAALPDSQVDIINRATFYYLAAVAVAFGFRMGLFNIGVDGQYRLATLMAAALGSASFMGWLPGALRIVLMVIVAMVVGAIWAGLAGLLKVTRGVSEVISTIMLNAVAGGLVAFLNTTEQWGIRPEGSNAVSTPLLPEDSWLPNLRLIADSEAGIYAFSLVAVLVGVGYWLLLERTRFGFDLRATGYNPAAAAASGVDAKRMVVLTMVVSGAIAGLVGLPQLLGETHAFTDNVGGVGFTGIAIALLGRSRPVGMALGALLWSFLDRSSLILDLADIPREIVVIMQGSTVLAVVVAYELAARLTKRVQARTVGYQETTERKEQRA
ncbi:MAG: ABC transporter permease [Micromonosporaceae bacterium]|nr:ABC transporter permease [Micromonosporaceae bacterium]